MTAAFGEDLILDVGARDAGVHVQLGDALHVEEISVTAVHVDDDGRDLEMGRGDALLRIAGRHRELELA